MYYTNISLYWIPYCLTVSLTFSAERIHNGQLFKNLPVYFHPHFRSSRSHIGLGVLHRNQRNRQNRKWYKIQHSWICYFGTILFMCTFIYKFYGIGNSNDYERIEDNGKCASVLSLMSTLFEDFPQIILALYVAFNTEDLLSRAQIPKACYGIIEPTIQLIFYACQYRRMRNDTGGRINFSMVCKVTEIVLSCVLIICSLVLLIDLLSTHQ